MIVVLIPSHFEAKAFVSELDDKHESHIGGADIIRGHTEKVEVTVGIIGMGLPHAPRRAETVIKEAGKTEETGDRRQETIRGSKQQGAGSRERGVSSGEHGAGSREIGAGMQETNGVSKVRGVSGVILAGFAGALEPGLKRGDIFVTAGAEFLLPHLPEAERPRAAKLATLEKIAGTAAAKKELRERTGAQLCDMEQAHVAEIARKLGVPFIGLRIVSDEAGEDLPADTLSQSYDQETGEYTPWKLAGHLTRHPFRTVPLASFVRSLPPVRNRMSQHLHTWLKLAGPRLFA